MESGKRKTKSDKQLSLFSQRLQMRRNQLGLTQDDLAQMAGEKGKSKGVKLLKSQIGKYETLEEGGDGFPSFTKGILLAETLECSLDWLFSVPREDKPDSGHSSSESVESILIRLIAAILEGEITDLSIVDFVEDKPAIILKHDLFDKFIDDYREALDFEEIAKEKCSDDSLIIKKAIEAKEEILVKYVKEYEKMKSDN